MKYSWGSLLKRMMICVIVNAAVLALGAGLLAAAVCGELIDIEWMNYLVFAILLTASFAAGVYSLNKLTGKMVLDGVLAAVLNLLISLIGGVLVGVTGERNVVGTAAVVITGIVLSMLLKIKTNNRRTSDNKNRKMVNLYKKQAR